MKISDNGLAIIKQFESCSLKAYKPIKEEKEYTIGWGHKSSSVKAGMVISQEVADELLNQDVAIAEKYVQKFVTVPLTQNQFDALVSFCYNVGSYAFRTSTLVAMLNANKYIEASEQFGRWVKGDNGQTLAGLVKRRNIEKALFLKDSCKKAKVTATVLNIRAGAGINYNVVGYLPKNAIVSLTDASNGFAKLLDGRGWVSQKYLTYM